MNEPRDPTNRRWASDGGSLSAAVRLPADYDAARVAARSLEGPWQPPPAAAPPRQASPRRIARAQAEREACAMAFFRALRANATCPKAARRDLLGPAISHMRRRSRAHLERAEAIAPTARCHLRADAVPLDVAFEQPADPREAEPAFRDAPAEEQQRLRAAWAAETDRAEARKARVRRHGRVAMREGFLLFAMLGVFFEVFFAPGILLPMLAAGPLVGLFWHLSQADRFGHALGGVLGFVSAAAAAGAIGPNPVLLFAAMLTAVICSVRAMRVEFRQLEGSD